MDIGAVFGLKWGMPIIARDIAQDIELVRRRSPLVHNITNYVVMNLTANALLAVGASPVMAHAAEEVEDMVGIASALVINIGTLSGHWVGSDVQGGAPGKKQEASPSFMTRWAPAPPLTARGPSASSSRPCRRPSCAATPRRSWPSPATSQEPRAWTAPPPRTPRWPSARQLSERHGCVVCVSGETDYIIDKRRTAMIKNGHAMMPKVTGLGCTASALCGAFAAVNPDHFAGHGRRHGRDGHRRRDRRGKSRGPGQPAGAFSGRACTI